MSTLVERQKAEVEAFIRASALSGKGVKQIAQDTGLPVQRIRDLAKEYGLGIVKVRGTFPALTDKQREMILVQASGIAQQYGLTLKQLNSVLMRELYPHKKKPAAQPELLTQAD